MKALLKKDIYVLIRQMRVFLLMIAVFAVLPGANMSRFRHCLLRDAALYGHGL